MSLKQPTEWAGLSDALTCVALSVLAHEVWDHQDTFILIGLMMVALLTALLIAVLLLMIRGWHMATAVVESLQGLHAALKNHLIFHVAEDEIDPRNKGL